MKIGPRTKLFLWLRFSREHANRASQPHSNYSEFLALLLWILFAAMIYAATTEWEHYRKIFSWQRQGLSAWDLMYLYWVLCGKTLVLCAPLALVSAIFILFQRPLWAKTFIWIATSMLYLWLTADLQTQTVTGLNVLDYLPYAWLHGAEWAGGGRWIIKHFAVTAGPILLATLASLLLFSAFTRYFFTANAPVRSRRIFWATCAFYFSGILGTILAPQGFGAPRILGQLYTALPINISWFGGTIVESPQKFVSRFHNLAMPALIDHRDRLMSARPADQSAVIRRANPANVVIIVVESFRHDSINPQWTPAINGWARRGMTLKNHYSGSNASQFGWFSLLYGRSPMVFDRDLDAGIEPQAAVTFRHSGYDLSYISAMQHKGWKRMEEFINPQFINQVIIENSADLPQGDRLALNHARRILDARGTTPQFIAVFLGSTHYPYRYPMDQEKYRPVLPLDQSVLKLNPAQHREKLLNRYKNAVSFLDKEIGSLLDALDLDRSLVVITGDHGEALFDDGTLSHATRLSDVQTKTPLVLVGAGIPKGVVEERLTTHADVLPTILRAVTGMPVEIAGVHGADLLDPRSLGSRSAILLVHQSTDPYPTVLVRRDGRLRINISLRNKFVKIVGSVDRLDKLDFPLLPGSDQAPAWAESFSEQMRVLAR